MLAEIVSWWSEQMLQWVPAALAGRDPVGANALFIEPVGDWTEGGVAGAPGFSLVLRRQQRDRALGRFELDGPGLRAMQAAVPSRRRPPSIVLRLPPGLLLEREVVLPLAAEREPERVLAYEMDRITPFSGNDLFWTHTVERRDRARGKLHLRLSMVTKAAVAPWLAALAQARLSPGMLEVERPGGSARRIMLQHPNPGRERLLRHAYTAAAAGCALLAVAAVAVPFVQQSMSARQVEARIGALQPVVAEAEALKRRIAASTAGVDVIAAERSRVGDALAVLAAVTDVLPDDTYLTDFTLRQGKLTMNGQSAAAARLIAAFSADPVIRNPDFAAPVTRIDNGHADLFAIRAEIAP